LLCTIFNRNVLIIENTLGGFYIMKKTAKVLACAACGALVAIGSIVLADRYIGRNYLGSPTGKVVGRCFKNGKFYLYVKRFNQVHEVEVDRSTCLSVEIGNYFDMASDGTVANTRRCARPEEVMNNMQDAAEIAEILGEEPVCSCVGSCNGEHVCEDGCTCGDGKSCECDGDCQCECPVCSGTGPVEVGE
jgi:hypothetical protein